MTGTENTKIIVMLICVQMILVMVRSIWISKSYYIWLIWYESYDMTHINRKFVAWASENYLSAHNRLFRGQVQEYMGWRNRWIRMRRTRKNVCSPIWWRTRTLMEQWTVETSSIWVGRRKRKSWQDRIASLHWFFLNWQLTLRFRKKNVWFMRIRQIARHMHGRNTDRNSLLLCSDSRWSTFDCNTGCSQSLQAWNLRSWTSQCWNLERT